MDSWGGGGKGLRITKGLPTQKSNPEFPKCVFTVVTGSLVGCSSLKLEAVISSKISISASGPLFWDVASFSPYSLSLVGSFYLQLLLLLHLRILMWTILYISFPSLIKCWRIFQQNSTPTSIKALRRAGNLWGFPWRSSC